MFASVAGKVVLQAAYFVLVARMLGAAEFGAFAAVVALAAIVAPFASLGTMQLMVRNIAHKRSEIGTEFPTAVTVTALSALCLGLIVGFVGVWIAPSQVSVLSIALILTSDLLLVRLVEVAGFAYQAVGRMHRTAMTTWMFHSSRLAAALVGYLGAYTVTLSTWVYAYIFASLCGAGVVLVVAFFELGFVGVDLASYRRNVGAGLLFSASLASQTVYNDIDKAMLGALSTAGSVGLYTAAYRIIDVSFAPMRSLMGAAYPRFFKIGATGVRATLRFAKKIAVPGMAYCLFSSAALFLGAGLVPLVLGSSYASSVEALRLLAILPVLKGVQYLIADALTGAGLQGRRTALQFGVAVLNVVANFVVLPQYSWRGAVFTSLLCDGLLALGLIALGWGAASKESGVRADESRRPSMIS